MILQYIVNKFLRLDPGSTKYLQELDGKVIAIICSDFQQLPVYIIFSSDYVQFSHQEPNRIDATIGGPLAGFVNISLNKQADLRSNNITVHGDLFSAEAMQKLLTQLNIDWEEELAKHTGDIIAHQALYILKQTRSYQAQRTDSLSAMIREYLQEEAHLLPTRYEVNEFMQEVDQLRLAVDRLAARISAYENI